jgi:hypothetical protein
MLICTTRRTELRSLDHSASRLFLSALTYFQSGSLPPSNAVAPGTASLGGYWPARKGRTRFNFAFDLPATSPSAVSFAGNATVRYSLKAIVQAQFLGERTIVMRNVNVNVIEKWDDWKDDKFWTHPEEEVERGAVRVELRATRPGVLFWKGEQCDDGTGATNPGRSHVELRIRIKNDSSIIVSWPDLEHLVVNLLTVFQISGLKLAVQRCLCILPAVDYDTYSRNAGPPSPAGPVVIETIHEDAFGTREYEFLPNETKVVLCNTELPENLWTVRKTRLFGVTISVKLTVVMHPYSYARRRFSSLTSLSADWVFF